MKNYSIVRVGHEYVVRVGEKSILKIASRRKAVKLITDAVELLEQEPVPQIADAPSISCDLGAISCPDIISDPSELP